MSRGDRGLRGLVVPDTNASEAAVVEELEVIPVSSLAKAAAFFAGHIDIDPVPSRLQELFSTLSIAVESSPGRAPRRRGPAVRTLQSSPDC